MKATTYEYGDDSLPEAVMVSGKERPTERQAVDKLGASARHRGGGMDRSARFWDRIAARYARRPVADEAAYQRKLEITREYLRPDMEVMEFGCGTGSTAIVHAPYVKHIRAVDISSRMLDIARRKAEAAGIDNITFEQSSIDDLEVPARSLDVVLGLSILHLLEHKDAVIAKVHDMLKPDGVFVSSTACLGDSQNWLRFVAPIGRRLGLIPFVSFFTKEDLRQSLGRAGFEIEHSWQPAKGKAVFMVAKKAKRP
ncbi:MAG: class I SAM-dependent methyltransferase [Rhodospirillales bacterium]|nr:class I SAM-dependent methyltransferase [Rhodospirillales bacterium]MDH3920647.1 class I SAM-dependent methyltransferase [Rhodospirillales bacterium]